MAEIKKPTQQEIEEGLKLLQKKRERQEKIKSGELKGHVSMAELKESNPAMYEKRRLQNRKNAARMQLLVKKAMDAGIKVSDAEIDAHLAKQGS